MVKKKRKKKTKGKAVKKIKRVKRAKRTKKAIRAIRAKKAVRGKKAIKGEKALKAKKKKAAIAYLGLGSNVGDREEFIEQAVFLLDKNPGIEVTKRSTNYETEAEKGDQPLFINAAVEIKTTLSPFKLLEVCQEIETTLGREREVEWGPRTIDLDILLYEGEIISEDKLQIPHPLLHERLFVLKPLAEIAPDVMHPALEKTIQTLYDEKKAEAGEKYDDELPGFKNIREGHFDDFERW